jgi:ADP-ribose pyrophosphatase YjhB (NUDIX family)
MIESRVLVWLLLEEEGAALIALRKDDRPPFAGQWTLPGDVMPINESATETIARCGREQLDISVRSEEFLATLKLKDGEVAYAVNVFRPEYLGRPRFRETGPYADVRWLLPGEVDDSLKMPSELREVLTSDSDRSAT